METKIIFYVFENWSFLLRPFTIVALMRKKNSSFFSRKRRQDCTYVPLYATRGFEGNWRVLRTETLHLHLYKSQTLHLCTREFEATRRWTHVFSLDSVLLLNFTYVFPLLYQEDINKISSLRENCYKLTN